MHRSRHRAARDHSRRAAGALLCASLSLAVALAFAAPLVHVHLEAASALARGLCGEHSPAEDQTPAGDACSICLAGGHAIGAFDHAVPRIDPPALSTSAGPPPAPADRSAPRGRPGAPRAPPHSA